MDSLLLVKWYIFDTNVLARVHGFNETLQKDPFYMSMVQLEITSSVV